MRTRETRSFPQPESDPSEAARRREARCVAGETREHTVECFAYVAYFKQGRADGIVAPRVAAETPPRKNQFTNTLDTVYGTGRGLMSQISFAYWSMVRSELNLPEKAVETMEDSVQPASFLYAASTFAWHSM